MTTDLYYVTDIDDKWLLVFDEPTEDGQLYWTDRSVAESHALQFGGVVRETKLDLDRPTDVFNFFMEYFKGPSIEAYPGDIYGTQESLF